MRYEACFIDGPKSGEKEQIPQKLHEISIALPSDSVVVYKRGSLAVPAIKSTKIHYYSLIKEYIDDRLGKTTLWYEHTR